MYPLYPYQLLLTRLSNRLFHPPNGTPNTRRFDLASPGNHESLVPFFHFEKMKIDRDHVSADTNRSTPGVEPSLLSLLGKRNPFDDGWWMVSSQIDEHQLTVVSCGVSKTTGLVSRYLGSLVWLIVADCPSADDRQTEVVRGCRACSIVEYPSGN